MIESAPRWRPLLWSLALAALAAGAVAAALDGTPRRIGLLAVLTCALALAGLVGNRSLPVAQPPVGGAGYEPPVDPRMRFLHALLTLLYSAGLMAVAYAAAARSGLLDTRASPWAVRLLPAALGLYVLLLAAAASWRIRGEGVTRAWYTRAHGVLLAFLATPLMGLAVLMVFLPSLRLGGLTIGEGDLVVLVLAGVLGVGTHLLLAVRLPTLLDLARSWFRGRPTSRGRLEETPPVLYAVVAALAVGAVAWFVGSRLGILRNATQLAGDRIAYLVLILPIALLAFFIATIIAIRREGRRGLYRKKIPTKLRNDLLVYGFSAIGGLLFGGLLIAVQGGTVASVGPFPAGMDLIKDLAVFTVLATAGPIGVYLHRQNRRIDGIESRLPDFLNDLAENRRAGLTLPAALQAAAQADYGMLSPDVHKMANQVAWGVPFNDALRQFAERTRSSLVRRSAYLVIESSRTGGSVAEILRAAARDAYELKALESERRITMATYMIVLYVVFFVFMVVVAVLDVRFIPEVLAANEAAQGSGSTGVQFIKVDQESLRFVYFNAALVQAIGNGLVAGVLAEGRVTAGLRHVTIMTLCAWVLFRFVLPLA